MLRMARHVQERDRREEPLPGRRRGAQLRGQRPDPARGALRRHLDPAGGRRRRRRPGRGPVRLAPGAGKARAVPATGATTSRAPTSGRRSPTTEIEHVAEARGIPYRTPRAARPVPTQVADIIADEKVVGWFAGRMEFGPRALGGAQHHRRRARRRRCSRSMNLKIKYRESFRPFAPSCLVEDVERLLRARPALALHAAGGAGVARSGAWR